MSMAPTMHVEPMAEEPKPCPGIPGDTEVCGEPREQKGGYCTGCRKRYQRQRYADQRGGSVRVYARVDVKDSDPFCNSCGSKTTSTLGQILDKRSRRPLPIPLVCQACYDIFMILFEGHRALQITAMARFIEAHRETFGLKANTAKDENVKRILYARWYEGEMEFQRDFAEGNDGFVFTEPNPRNFTIDPDEYDKIAARMSSSGVLGLPELTFEVINAGGEPEKTKFHG